MIFISIFIKIFLLHVTVALFLKFTYIKRSDRLSTCNQFIINILFKITYIN